MTDPVTGSAARQRDSRGRAARSADSTITYLQACVRHRSGCDATTAREAVAEVIDALRHNPAWLHGLGIGDA